MAAVEAPPRPWDDVLAAGLPPGPRRLAYLGEEAPAEARYEHFPGDLDPWLASALIREGVCALYAHQAAAWRASRAGRHVCIVTGTASGKSLAFNLPVLAGLLERPGSRALYLYPTKALAQDQARALASLGGPLVRPMVYDGDTPPARRAVARQRANPLLTNPDMLHAGILPQHARFAELLGRLTHVVVDEAHAYRGVFGSHVALVLRRLRRLCAAYGADPQFLLASATVANPAASARALLGVDVEVVDDDGAARAHRSVAFWQPPLLDRETGERASALVEAAALLAALVGRGLRTICFAKSRKATELIYRMARERLQRDGDHDAAERLAPYRAGYTPEARRAIEADLLSGELLGVVATDALELGIDVGLLDCAVSTGFPGSVASLRQQWGRAGRRGDGLAVFIPSDDGLDQFFARHPAALLDRRCEAVVLDPTSREIRLGHLAAAADEAAITPADDAVLGEGAHAAAEELADAGELLRTPAGLVWRGGGRPARHVSLRSIGGGAVCVVEAASGTVLGVVEDERAPWTVHEGAVYLHGGEAWLVQRLDLEEGVALVEPFAGGWYTAPRRATDTRILGLLAPVARRAGTALHYGDVEVTDRVTGYQRRALPGHAALDALPLDLPERRFRTTALWLVPGDDLLALAGDDVLAALHAVEHALVAVLPLYALCDRWDVGSLSLQHPQTGRPTVVVYDGHPGGVGLARRGAERFEALVADAARIVTECPCEAGCPSCVQSPRCGSLNERLDKAAAARLLAAMAAAG